MYTKLMLFLFYKHLYVGLLMFDDVIINYIYMK